MKSVQIRSYFWSVFSPNVGKYGTEITTYLDTVSLRIQSEYLKKRTRKIVSLDTFHAVNFPPWLFSHFLNCTNPTKLRKAFHAFFQKTEMSLKIEGTFLETIHAFFLKDCLVVKSLLKSSGKFFEDIHSFILMLHGYRFTFL